MSTATATPENKKPRSSGGVERRQRRKEVLEFPRRNFLLEMADENEKDKQIGEEEEEEEEYVLLELDDCLYSNIQPNAPYTLSGLDTMTPTLVVGDGLKMIGEYEETVGTCYLFSESDAPPKPVRDRTARPKESKGKQASNSKQAPARPKEVKHLASVQKILKFRSMDEDHHQ